MFDEIATLGEWSGTTGAGEAVTSLQSITGQDIAFPNIWRCVAIETKQG